jgi:Eukaryotic mitochondrial regulator protein
MPPPRPLPLSFTSTLIQSSRPQTQCVHSLFIQSRQFSASPSHQKRTIRLKRFTRQRRKLFNWLNNVGAEFKIPRADRTPSYLGSIKADGRTESAFNASVAAKGQEGGAPTEEPKKDEDSKTSDSEAFDPNEAEREEAEKRSDSYKNKKPSREEPRKVPWRTLMPFPLNQNFKSEPVLSEEFREIIYLKVVEEKMPVRSVSAEYGVSMERVGAVVRMKQMERDWVQQVSYHHLVPS